MSRNYWWGSSGYLAAISLLIPTYTFADNVADAEALCRVLYAEASGQPIAGKVAVIEVILNRARITGTSIEHVVNEPRQFEPVTKAGGNWHNLRQLTPAEQAECNAILQLKEQGWLNEVVPGADHFQNPVIVADRAKAGSVKPELINFDGMPVISTIGDHRFYKGGTTPHREKHEMASRFVGREDTEETQLVETNN